MGQPSFRRVFWILGVLNICTAIWQASIRIRLSPPLENNTSHSFIGDDYPLEYPIGSLEPVAMTLYQSVRFSLDPTDAVANLSEWATIGENPKGFGRTRLGPDHRVFVLTFYHQFHCLRKIQVALIDRNDSISTAHHFQHCLNYLRQTFLCSAADMLEEGDFMAKDWDEDRQGDSLVCKDWRKVYDVLDTKYEEWVRWKMEWN